MKTNRISILRKALSVFLACMMVLCGLAISFPVLRANADVYGFDATTAAWETDKLNWKPIEKSLYSITGYNLLIVYEKNGQLYAFGSDSSSIIPIRIAMATSEGGLVRYSQTSLNPNTSNSGDFANTLYWQTSVGYEGANHNMNFKLGNAYTGYGIVKEEYNLSYSGITTFTVDDNGWVNNYKVREGYSYGHTVAMLSTYGDYNVRVYYNNGDLARSSITYNANGGTGSVATQTDIVGFSVTIQGNGFSKAGHHFTGWNTAADGSGTPYTPGQTYLFGNSMTLYAQWEADKFPIRFLNYDGTVLQNSEFAYGTTPVYSGANPAKPGSAQYSYSFIGWSPSIHTVTGTETYTAQFSENVNTYTVTWKN